MASPPSQPIDARLTLAKRGPRVLHKTLHAFLTASRMLAHRTPRRAELRARHHHLHGRLPRQQCGAHSARVYGHGLPCWPTAGEGASSRCRLIPSQRDTEGSEGLGGEEKGKEKE